MQGQYNLRSPAVKRLMREAQELCEPTEQFHAQPLEDNLFEWHFTIRGPADSEFDNGVYHGRIILPPEYPMKPPSIILLTPNGRFEIFKKICLSISGHHPESWQPSWSIRTALLAIIGFMPTHGHGAIGSLDYTPEERKVLAKRSQTWTCEQCGNVANVLKPVTSASDAERKEAKELASQIAFQAEKPKGSKNGDANEETTPVSTSTSSPVSEAGATQSPSSQPTMPNLPGFPPFNPNIFRPPFPMPPFMPGMNQLPRMGVNNPRPHPGMWTPMMQQQFMQQLAQMNANQTPSTTPPVTVPPSSTSPAQYSERRQDPVTTPAAPQEPSASSAPKPTASSTSDPSSSTASGQAISPEMDSPPTTSSPASSSPTTASTTPTQPVPSTSSTPPQPASSVRQRTPAARSSPPAQAAGQAGYQSAELPRARQQQEESPVVLGLMILLGLAIAALIARRLYMTDMLNFDL